MLNPATKVSVVIANRDYARYLPHAIDSALALDWPDVEVIVVDDGSTDDSCAVVAAYAARVRSLTQAHAGQASACRRGFAASRGDVVIFLDADDVLDRSLLQAIAPVWHDGVSKAQVAMRTIDGDGRDLANVFPRYASVEPRRMLAWSLSSASYPTPPGSGNVYARRYLDAVIASIERVDRAADTALIAAAPFHGDVVTIARPLVAYRVHDRNDGAMSTLDATRFAREWSRARRRFDYLRSVAEATGHRVRADAFGVEAAVLSHRAASFRLARAGHPIAGDTRWRIVAAAFHAVGVDQAATPAARLALATWVALVCVLPVPMARRLVAWNFVASSRPRWLRARTARRVTAVGTSPVDGDGSRIA